MRKFFRFIDIVIVGILLTVLALCLSSTDIVLNKKTVTKEINNAGLYDKLNDSIKEQVINELEDEFDRQKDLDIDLRDLVDNTITVDVLNDETEFILEQIYEDNDKVVLDIDILIDGYTENLKVYLDKNDIELPVEIDRQIEEIKENSYENEIDVTEYTEQISPYFQKFKETANNIILILSVIIVVLILLSLVISKEKLRVLYKPFILAGIALLIIRVIVTVLYNSLDMNFNDETQEKIIISIKDALLSNVDKFMIGFLAFGIIVMVVRIVLDKKKNASSDENIQMYDNDMMQDN